LGVGVGTIDWETAEIAQKTQIIRVKRILGFIILLGCGRESRVSIYHKKRISNKSVKRISAGYKDSRKK